MPHFVELQPQHLDELAFAELVTAKYQYVLSNR